MEAKTSSRGFPANIFWDVSIIATANTMGNVTIHQRNVTSP
jgi:hypothetical protein